MAADKGPRYDQVIVSSMMQSNCFTQRHLFLNLDLFPQGIEKKMNPCLLSKDFLWHPFSFPSPKKTISLPVPLDSLSHSRRKLNVPKEGGRNFIHILQFSYSLFPHILTNKRPQLKKSRLVRGLGHQ